MIEVEFDMNQQIITVQANLNDIFQTVIDSFIKKTLLDPETVFFITNGKPIDPNQTVEKQISKLNKANNKMKVLVQFVKNDTKVDVFIQSNEVICPDCKEPCLLETKNYKIKLFNCKNNHTNLIKIKDFPSKQKINISKILCEICSFKDMGNCSNNEFYKCLTCNKNICLLCKQNHNPNHNIINYDIKNYICLKHNEHLIKYCKDCNVNICFSCDEHGNHNLISFDNLRPNINETKNKLNEIKNEIESFNNKINEIINKLNELKDIMNIYYEINYNIFNIYQNQKRNYQILKNIKQINDNNEILEKIKVINSNNNIKDNLFEMIDLCNNINSDENENKNIENNNITINTPLSNKLNQMTIYYKIDKNQNDIRLFGGCFVYFNKNNCILLIDDQHIKLCETLKLNNNQKNYNILKVKLIEINPITNMRAMFSLCTSLISLPDIDNWNTKNVNNMMSIFDNCRALEYLPDISKWDLKNVNTISAMFCGCRSLKSLPDISKWNTKNIKNMSAIFQSCSLLNSLPDISKWDTTNVTEMSYMFTYCTSLESLPDISKWNLTNIEDISNMFSGCSSLKSFPDISNIKIKKGIKTENMFKDCKEEIIPKEVKYNCNIY